jgi:hypothetical protein
MSNEIKNTAQDISCGKGLCDAYKVIPKKDKQAIFLLCFTPVPVVFLNC